jgi:hypothetical protein
MATVTVSLGDACFETLPPMKKNTNPFLFVRRNKEFYADIELVAVLPDLSNAGYPELKPGRPREGARDWRELLKKQPVKTSISLDLFYVKPDLLKTCKYCKGKNLVLSHVARKGELLIGCLSCQTCGARRKTAALPTPKLIADVVCELKRRSYSTASIQNVLSNFDVSISLSAIARVLAHFGIEKGETAITRLEIIEIIELLQKT